LTKGKSGYILPTLIHNLRILMKFTPPQIPASFQNVFSQNDAQLAVASFDILQVTCTHYGPNGDIAIGSDYDKELRRQVTSYLVIGDALASAKTTADGIKLALDSMISIAELRTREAYEDDEITSMPFPITGTPFAKMGKATEGVIRATVDSYDVIRGMKDLSNQAAFFVNKLSNLKDAWLQRSIMLRTLVEHEMQGIMNTGTISSTEGILAEKGRKAMAEARTKS